MTFFPDDATVFLDTDDPTKIQAARARDEFVVVLPTYQPGSGVTVPEGVSSFTLCPGQRLELPK